MRVLNLIQGTPAWLAARAKYRTASEASAMMGASKYQTRSALLHQKATGDTLPVDPHRQALFAQGHATEALARQIVEEMLGEDLFPVTAACDKDYLLASFDGINMLEDTGFEHKLFNAELAEQVRACDLEPHYYWQLEQQILVGGLSRILFVCSDGTRDKFEWMEYRPVPGRAEQLLAGWRQFDADLAAYQPRPATPTVTVPAIDGLPALHVSLVGEVRESNIATWKDAVIGRIQAINTALETDDDFAVAEKTCKFLGDGEKELNTVKQQALAQTASIDDLFKTIDNLREEMRSKRLTLEKLVKARKEAIRGDIVQAAQMALSAHVAAINQSLGLPCLHYQADLAGAMKNKKTLASLQDAVDTALAQAKIEANGLAAVLRVNLATIRETDSQYPGLFPDASALARQTPEQLAATIAERISAHQAREAQRLAAERARAEAQAATPAPVLVAASSPVTPATSNPPYTPGPSRLEAANAHLARFLAEYADLPELAGVVQAIKTHLTEYETKEIK